MRNLHCSGHFLRLLRSICAKTACARRAIVALFVVVATILATFMIMPSASMGASSQNESKQEQTQSQTKSENVEPKTEQDVNTAESKADAKGGASASGENGESKSADLRAVESVNPQPSTNPDAPNADHAQNVDSEKKQGAAKEGASKNPNQDVKKDAAERAKKEESAKKLRRQKRELGNTRAAAGGDDFPEECKNVGSLAECYKVKYEPHFSDRGKISVRGQEFPANPTFKPVEKKFKSKKVNYEKFVTGFVLEKLMVSRSEEAKNNGLVTLEPKTGKITVYANKWIKGPQNYYAYVKVTYSDGSYTTNFDCPTDDTKCVKSKPLVRLSFSVARIEGAKGDLSLKVYNHQDSKGRSEVQDTNGVTFTSDDKGNFSPITPIFIDSKSKEEPGYIHHHMICHKKTSTNGSAETSESDDSYTLDSVNGLNLKDKDNGTGTQTQFKHVGGKKPSTGTDAYAVYEKGDDITERSQSWITGKPQSDGTFECKVFAFKDVKLNKQWHEGMSKQELESSSTLVKEFDTRAGTQAGMQSLFGGNIVDSNTWKTDDFKQGIDWDYKTIKIVFESKKKKKLDVKDGDLKLSVYPFKNNDSGSGGASAALADGDTVSVMKGMELKPFIEATSKADFTKQITLKMLCSKGEKPQKTNAGAAGGASNASKTGAAGFEYTKWVDPSSLGFSFPDDKAQNPCTSNEGEQNCKPDGSDTKFAARTNASATFMSTEDGYYKCVVYALKPDALTKFNAVTTATPDTLSAAFAGLKADKDYAQLAVYIHVTKDFTLPHTGGQNWNLQLGAVAAVMVSVLAAGFVISQSEACRKLLYERRRC